MILIEKSTLKNNYFSKTVRIAVASVYAFIKDNCYLKASALTYYTLLSIVPVLAIIFGIAKGFGFEAFLQKEIMEVFSEQKEVVHKIIEFARALLAHTEGAPIVGMGVLVLFYSIYSLMASIESEMNDIWRLKTGRSYARQFSDYLAAMFICLIFFVAINSLSLFALDYLKELEESTYWSKIIPFLLTLLKILPLLLCWALFSFLYLFMPNTQVRFSAGLAAGIISGTLFILWQWFYIKFQSVLFNYGPIYGSFAALPLFLVWLQVSWLIVLFGAEIAAHIDNDLPFEGSVEELCEVTHKEVGLLILYRCVMAFENGEPPLTSFEIAKDLGISVLYTKQMLEIFEEADLLTRVRIPKQYHRGYLITRDAHFFSVKGVFDVIDSRFGYHTLARNSETLKKIKDDLKVIDDLIIGSEANQRLFPLK